MDFTFLPKDIREALCEKNRIRSDIETCKTPHANIFAGGDVATGPKTVIEAIAAGRKAALAISETISPHSSRHLRIISNERILYHDVHVDESMGDARRMAMPHRGAKQRTKGFYEIKKGYSPDDAVREAKRCLKCNFEKMMGSES